VPTSLREREKSIEELVAVFPQAGKGLLNSEKLRVLAKQPGLLDQHVKKFCGEIGKDMKALVYGPSRRGRPTQAQRDVEIARMYDEEQKTFGQIVLAR
jgi:hypothetical protein